MLGNQAFFKVFKTQLKQQLAWEPSIFLSIQNGSFSQTQPHLAWKPSIF